MNAKRFFRTFIILVILGSNIGCDQISKNLVRQKIAYDEQISFINNHFTVMKVENTGAFLSLGYNLPMPLKLLLLNIVPLIVLALALGYLLTTKNLSDMSVLGVCFIIGGGVGNIYDRVIYGSVTDFLHIDFVLFETGVFNMADVSIMIGLFTVIFDTYVNRKRMEYDQ